jgi:hypothetical protein
MSHGHHLSCARPTVPNMSERRVRKHSKDRSVDGEAHARSIPTPSATHEGAKALDVQSEASMFDGEDAKCIIVHERSGRRETSCEGRRGRPVSATCVIADRQKGCGLAALP